MTVRQVTLGISPASTASGYSKKDTDLGAKARFDRANAEGGVQGLKKVTGGAKGRSVAILANDNDAGTFAIRTYKQSFAAAGYQVTYAK
ncbi:hypothetical protein [Streptomyces luteocolor]|uniref:hypothetical protein n=1 Tax=Streptomyces luteocolor TaxID=285500 RepID=UPI000853AF03|nr:hypothetical protein [Streptomyces luteocolor]